MQKTTIYIPDSNNMHIQRVIHKRVITDIHMLKRETGWMDAASNLKGEFKVVLWSFGESADGCEVRLALDDDYVSFDYREDRAVACPDSYSKKIAEYSPEERERVIESLAKHLRSYNTYDEMKAYLDGRGWVEV